jgi:NADH:ubiquinone oxidoreductase subunit 6 (subunit J)
MEPIQVVFLIGAALVLFSAVMVVTRSNLIHAALYLILTLFGVAMIFVLLEAFYWAVIQVVVYIGAIAIMIIMAIMVTRDITGEEHKPFNKNVVWAGLLGLLVIGTLVWALTFWPQYGAEIQQTVDSQAVISDLGTQFFSAQGYLIPSLVASILLLAALIAAIKIAFPIKQEED